MAIELFRRLIRLVLGIVGLPKKERQGRGGRHLGEVLLLADLNANHGRIDCTIDILQRCLNGAQGLILG